MRLKFVMYDFNTKMNLLEDLLHVVKFTYSVDTKVTFIYHWRN